MLSDHFRHPLSRLEGFLQILPPKFSAYCRLARGVPLINNVFYSLKFKAFHLHLPVLAHHGRVLLELGRGGVLLERGGVCPRFANQEHIGAGGAGEHIVGDAAFVVLGVFGEGFGGLQRSLELFAVMGLKKAIQSYHTQKFACFRN